MFVNGVGRCLQAVKWADALRRAVATPPAAPAEVEIAALSLSTPRPSPRPASRTSRRPSTHRGGHGRRAFKARGAAQTIGGASSRRRLRRSGLPFARVDGGLHWPEPEEAVPALLRNPQRLRLHAITIVSVILFKLLQFCFEETYFRPADLRASSSGKGLFGRGHVQVRGSEDSRASDDGCPAATSTSPLAPAIGLLTTGSGITSCAWLLEYTDESSTCEAHWLECSGLALSLWGRRCDAPVSRAPFPESEHAGRRFLYGSSEVALLVARLDQDVVKQWRIAKYQSVIKVDPEYLGSDVRSQSMYLFLDLQHLGTLAAIVIGFAASFPVQTLGPEPDFYGLARRMALISSLLATPRRVLALLQPC